jgi:hypothetical protein
VAAVSELQILRVDPTGYDALGRLAGGAAVNLSGVFADALTSSASVRIVRQNATVLLELGATDIAAPGRLRILEGGEERLPLVPFETPHRGAWRRLHAAVTGGESGAELADFTWDATLVADAIPAAATGEGLRVAG